MGFVICLQCRLVANKKDVAEKAVTPAEGSAFNRAYRLESHVQTSAKDFDSVKLAFQILVRPCEVLACFVALLLVGFIRA